MVDTELVKVEEVAVMTEDGREEVEATVIGRAESAEGQESSNESTAAGDKERSTASVQLDVDR